MFKCECGSTEFKAVMNADIKVTTESGYPEYIAGSENMRNANISGLFECVKCKKIYSDIWENKNAEDSTIRRCVCGNARFSAHQVCYHDVIVGSDNDFVRDVDIGDAENPYGPYTCTQCDAEYEELDELDAKTELEEPFNAKKRALFELFQESTDRELFHNEESTLVDDYKSPDENTRAAFINYKENGSPYLVVIIDDEKYEVDIKQVE